MIDSQAVKNTCNASIESKGFYFYQSTNGNRIKRDLAVDTLGFLFFTHCSKANLSAITVTVFSISKEASLDLKSYKA